MDFEDWGKLDLIFCESTCFIKTHDFYLSHLINAIGLISINLLFFESSERKWREHVDKTYESDRKSQHQDILWAYFAWRHLHSLQHRNYRQKHQTGDDDVNNGKKYDAFSKGWLSDWYVNDFSDNSSPMWCVSCVNRHNNNFAFFLENLRPVENPMLSVLHSFNRS